MLTYFFIFIFVGKNFEGPGADRADDQPRVPAGRIQRPAEQRRLQAARLLPAVCGLHAAHPGLVAYPPPAAPGDSCRSLQLIMTISLLRYVL